MTARLKTKHFEKYVYIKFFIGFDERNKFPEFWNDFLKHTVYVNAVIYYCKTANVPFNGHLFPHPSKNR